MVIRISLGDISAEVVQKDIKNVHLSVHPPAGKVRISAPLRMNVDTIRIFALSKLDWIKQQQRKFRDQERETPREYLDRESHYVWGRRYLLKVVESDAAPAIELKHKTIHLRVRPNTSNEKKQALLEEWYREELKKAVPPLVSKWEPIIAVKVKRFFAQRMKTKWGSCRPDTRAIRLNTDLAKKPPHCLEYILVHELIHLREPTHNSEFMRLMAEFMPQWRFYRAELNRLPVRHEEWDY